MILRAALGLFGLSLALGVPVAHADDFALSVSPPRFELTAEPGKTVRGVAVLSNASSNPTELRFATAEWELTPDGGVKTSAELKDGSCRPWVAIERADALLPGKTELRYRFEVTPPEDSPPVECRFAILVSGKEERVSPTENTSFPVAAQIALIVYVAVGDIKPEIQIVDVGVADVNGALSPVLMVRNSGTAHGRLSAFLQGTDAQGVKREFAPSTLPILPGETRMIALSIDDGGEAISAAPALKREGPVAIAYPLTVGGTITDTVKSFRFDAVFEP